jgi:CBS domain containing-hemolysin-like protein
LDDPLPYVYLLILFIILSGVFSGAETALVSLTPAKVRTLIERKRPGSGIISRLKRDPSRLLITILIGNNIVNITASALATITAERYFGDAGLSIAIGGMTLLILVFGEIMPKTLAHKYNVHFSLLIGPFIYVLGIILTPIIAIFHAMSAIIPHDEEALATEEELRAMVDLTHEAGEISAHESEYIKNIFEFTDTTVEEIMIPRTDIDAISEELTVKEALDHITKSAHSRIPVYKERLDNITGVLTVKDILKQSRRQRTMLKKIKKLKLIKPVYVPVSAPLYNLFNEFQKKHVHLAIVVDEFGGTEGLVTMEDVLEEIVGNIIDESDIETSGIEKISERSYMVDGDVTIEDLRESKIPIQTRTEEHKTISFVILQKLGHIPKVGEKTSIGKNRLIIEKISKNAIDKVKIVLPHKPSKD